MTYQIGRDGQQLGSFTQEQIVAGLANGSLRTTDLGWKDGMDDWEPLSSLLPDAKDQPVAAPQLPVMPVSPPVIAASSPPVIPVISPSVVKPTPPFGAVPQTEGLATASLVLGLLGFLLSCVTALPAVICGHVALGRIRRSGGALSGGGMAVAGLVMGYLHVLLVPVIAMLVALAVPTFSGVQEKAQEIQAMNNLRQVMVAVKTYAADHQGKYPASLDQLVQGGELTDLSALEYPQFQKWSEATGYDYLGATMTDSDPAGQVVFKSHSEGPQGKHIVAHNDGSVAIEPASKP